MKERKEELEGSTVFLASAFILRNGEKSNLARRR